jgi:hypothetical protein
MTVDRSRTQLILSRKVSSLQIVLILFILCAGVPAAVAQQSSSDVRTGSKELIETDSVTQLREDVQALRAEVERLRALVAQGQVVPAHSTLGSPEQRVGLEKSEQSELTEVSKPEPQSVEAPSDTRAAKYVDWRGGKSKISLFDDRVRLSGYGSVRFETNDVSSGNSIPSGSGSGFTFRRFVLATDAKPAPRIRIYSEIEYERLHELESEKQTERAIGSSAFKQTIEGNAGGELSVEQAWGQFNFAENHGIRSGVVLVPVGRYNLLHDDDYWDIPRRTLTDRDASVLPVKAAWRDLGAGVVGSFNIGDSGRLDYQAYVLNGAALDFNIEHELVTEAGSPGSAELVANSEMQLSSGFFDGSKSATAFAWRTAYSPNLHGEFAFSGYHGKYAPSFVSFREALTTFAYDHKWRWRGFETEGEAVYTSLGNLNNVLLGFGQAVFNSENSTNPSSSAGGLTTTVEMELANLSRRRYGFWWDFKYHARPGWLKRSFLGRSFEDPQIIPIVRYERVWLNGVTDDVAISSTEDGLNISFKQEDLEQDRITAGLSFRPVQQFAIQAAYERNRRIQGSKLIFPKVDQGATNGLILGMSFAF